MVDSLGNLVQLKEGMVYDLLGCADFLQVLAEAVFQEGVKEDFPLPVGEVPTVRPLGEGFEELAGQGLGKSQMIEEFLEPIPDQHRGGEVGDIAGDLEVFGLVGDRERAASHSKIKIARSGNIGKRIYTKMPIDGDQKYFR